jgi:catechol 2,3-dioxygenase-like lactoylglutathione lyase family enzyme
MRLFAALVLGLSAVLLPVLLRGQAPAPAPAGTPAGPTIGFMHAIHATNNVETTLAFYTSVFGVNTKVQPFANAAVPLLTDSPGVTLRIAMLRLPGEGFGFELTEFTGVARRPAQPRITDPGAPHMKFVVRDIDQVVTNIKAAKAPMISRSGAPVDVQTAWGRARAITFRDPDGYIVQALQMLSPAAASAPPAGNVLGSIMGETIGDMEKSMRFWRDQMGFDLTPSLKWVKDAAMADLMGVPADTEFRIVSGIVPGSRTAQNPTGARIEFIEFNGTPKTPFDLRVPDPGASGIAIRVADIVNLVARLKTQGVRIISRNGELVEWSPTVRNAFIKDPDGFNVEIVGDIGPAPGAAPPPAGRGAQ